MAKQQQPCVSAFEGNLCGCCCQRQHDTLLHLQLVSHTFSVSVMPVFWALSLHTL
jgi:hypothetical protein